MATAETREELERLSLRSTTARSSGSDDLPTPNASSSENLDESVQGNDANGANSNSRFAKRWEEALKRCEKSLKEDYQTAAQYDSPEKLLAGLDALQREHGARMSPLSRLIDQIVPTQRSFKELTAIFIAVMLPYSVTTTLAWGLLYLCVKLCKDHATASKRLEDMLAKIRRRLALFNCYASSIADSNHDELCLTFVDVFEAIINFWSYCVKYFRSHPPQTQLFQQDSSELESTFQDTISRIDDSMNHLQCLSSLETGVRERQLYRTDLDSRITESTAFPVFLLPDTRTSHFVGREDTMEAITRYFMKGEVDKDGLYIYSICGIGGIGKTELALRYAKLHSAAYDAIFWVGAESVESLRQGFTRIALELGLPGSRIDGNPDHHLTLVHLWLRSTKRSWLLIFDNMEKYDNIQRYLPFECQGCVIVTTRYAEQAQHCRRKLSIIAPLSIQEAETLFMRLLQQQPDDESNLDTSPLPTQPTADLPVEEKNAIRYLLTQMDGLVLGIQQIVALIRYQDLAGNIAKFAEKYRKRPQNFHKKSNGIAGHTLATLWELSFASMRANENAWVVLGILCCLQPDEIPKTLFLPDDPLIQKGKLSFCTDEDDLDEAIDVLKAAGLVERRKDKLSIHRLVQVAFLFQSTLADHERQEIFNFASILIDHAFPTQVRGRQMYDQWETCQTYIQHAQSIALLFAWLERAGHAVVAPEAFAHLMSNCAWHLYECGTQRDALQIVEIAIDSCSEKESLVYAHLLNSAMISYFKLNDVPNARRVLEASRAIREKLLDPNDEDLAATYANFGSIEAAEGHFDEAYAYYVRAHKLRIDRPGTEAMQGLDHLCMGRVLFHQGGFDGAIREYALCEELYSKFEPDHYLQVRINFTWGSLEAARGNYTVAKERLTRALQILLKQTPSEMKVASTYFKIGSVELGLGNFRDAMGALNKGLRIARLRGEDGKGEMARILWKQAQVLEKSPHSADALALADMEDPEHLRGEAEAILRKLRRDAAVDDEDEDALFDSLVNMFDR